MPGLKTNEREGTRAVLRHTRVSAYKVREVLDLVRGRPVHEAEDILRFSERDVAFTVGKVLQSAVANAQNNDDLEPEELYVSACFADEGTTIKRWRPRARGRATRIRKRTCHITVIVSRLSEDQLQRLQAHRRAEQLAQRARRVAGARRAEGDTRNRADRRRGVSWEETQEEHEHEGEPDAESAVLPAEGGLGAESAAGQQPADSVTEPATDESEGAAEIEEATGGVGEERDAAGSEVAESTDAAPAEEREGEE
jgi:large subunit ribosomal protein L22